MAYITALEEYDCGCISISSLHDESVLMVAAEERGDPDGTAVVEQWKWGDGAPNSHSHLSFMRN